MHGFDTMAMNYTENYIENEDTSDSSSDNEIFYWKDWKGKTK